MLLQIKTIEKSPAKYTDNKTILVAEMSKHNNELLSRKDMENFMRDMKRGSLKPKDLNYLHHKRFGSRYLIMK